MFYIKIYNRKVGRKGFIVLVVFLFFVGFNIYVYILDLDVNVEDGVVVIFRT